MPRVRLTKIIPYAAQEIKLTHFCVMLKSNDRYTVIDLENDNVLIDGMTESFKQRLIDKGLLHVEG